MARHPGRDKALVNIIVEFSVLYTETMTLKVIVPNEGDEAGTRTRHCKGEGLGPQFAADRQ